MWSKRLELSGIGSKQQWHLKGSLDDLVFGSQGERSLLGSCVLNCLVKAEVTAERQLMDPGPVV